MKPEINLIIDSALGMIPCILSEYHPVPTYQSPHTFHGLNVQQTILHNCFRER
jgi:hypothetical protein